MFERGFLITETNNTSSIKETFLWKSYELKISDQKKYRILYDYKTDFASDTKNNSGVLLIGMCVDLKQETMDLRIIAKELLESLIQSVDCFYNRIDYLNGRFALLYWVQNELHITNDATGTRSIYYNTENNVVSSHYEMINLITNCNLDSFWDKYQLIKEKRGKYSQPWCLPGDLTPYSEIKLLVPNHELNISTGKIKRIWPRKNMPETNYDDIVDKISHIIRTEYMIISSKAKIVQSITMGNDSRISLAASKENKDNVIYFTYKNKSVDFDKSSIDVIDRYRNYEFARNICDKEKLNFVEINIDSQIPNELSSQMNVNHYHSHIPGATTAYIRNFPEGCIHIRSNIIEAIRHTYYTIPSNSKNKMEEYFSMWEGYRKEDFFEEVTKVNIDYIKRNAFEAIYDYDPGDLFYLEYRMGQWMSAVLIENDLAFDTFMLFNNRIILEYGLSTPRFIKDKNALVFDLIKTLWPDLLNYGIPNTITANYDLIEKISQPSVIDFKLNLRGSYDYKLESNSIGELKPAIYFEPFNTSFILGFQSNKINKGDECHLSFKRDVTTNRSYYLEIDVLTNYSNVARYGDIVYYIKIDNNTIYELDTQEYGGKINQIIYCFKSSENKELNITVGLRALKDPLKKNSNSSIIVKAIIFKSEYNRTYDDPIIISSRETLLEGERREIKK